MASGTIKGTKTGYYGVEIDWVATKNSASANTSTVVSKVYITYYSINIAGRTATSSINGVSVSFSVPAINDKPNSSTRRLIYTHTATVAHNTDGTKTGVTISASFPFNLSSSTYGEIGTLSASKVVNFDTIARTSALSIPSTTITTDTAFTATITKPDSTFRSRLAVLIDGTQKAITDYFTATSYSYTIPSSFIPSASSDVMVLRLYTYTSSGTTALGYVDKSVTVNVLSTLMPTVSISATISSGGLNGYYVQNKSITKLTVSSKAGNGSTIKSYTFTGPNVNASTSADSISVSSTATSYTLTTGTIKSTGTLKYQVTVYDARGRYATASVDVYVYPYAVPEITAASIQRCDSSGSLAKDGTYVKYTINSKFSPVLVGTTINNWRTVTICHSSNGGSTYGAVTTLQPKTTTDISITGKYGDGTILTSNAYKFKIVITDQYGATDTEYVDLGSIERPLNIAKYGNGVAVGGFSSVTDASESPKFECHWPTYIEGRRALTVGEVEGTARLLTNVFVKNFRSQPTGYMCIRLGTATMSLYNMITVKGHITSYQNSTSFEASCYFYYDNGTFHMPVATMSNPNIVQEVYFAQGISDGCVYLILGAIDSLWAYPTVAIDSVSVGFANPDSDAWTSGWEAEVYADLASNFTKLTSCTRGGMNKTLWSGTAGIGTTLTLSENFRNFKFLTCIIGTTTEPYGIVLGSFLDSTIAELHFGAIFTNSGGLAGSNFYGAKFATSGGTSVTLAGCGTAAASNLSVKKIVGWR